MMDINRENIVSFREGIAKKITFKGLLEYSHLKDYPLHDKQCLYIFDWTQGVIVFEIGLKKLLGYDFENLYLENMMEMVHPGDRYFVEKITKEAVLHTYTAKEVDTRLFITYRLKKKNGQYVKIMRQTSSYEHDEKGNMMSNISILTDISFMGNNDRVDWELQSSGLNVKRFRENIYTMYRELFSTREKEVLRLMNLNKTSAQIAIQLHLSKHTIQTHRKNILRKAKSHSIDDVLLFCKKNGILE